MNCKMNVDKNILNDENLKKLEALNNPKVIELVEQFVNHCKPAKVTVLTDSKEDINYVRQLAIKSKEEMKLAMEGHTIHYDSYYDQARDKGNTCVLLPKGKTVSNRLRSWTCFRIVQSANPSKTSVIGFFRFV